MDPALYAENLSALTASELSELRALKVSRRQEVFGGSFSETVAVWQAGPTTLVLGFCFFFQARPVGVAVFKRPPLSPSWVEADAASIHGLKIAAPFQGRRWGHIAFRLALQQMQEAWPAINTLMLAVDAQNLAALAVYRAFGMQDSGPVFEGNNGPEHHLRIPLKTR